MKKTLAMLTLLLCVSFMFSFSGTGKGTDKKNIKTKPACTLVLPTVHVSYSGSNTIITLTGGSGDGFTVGGYYSLLMYGTFHSCPAGSTTTIPTLSGGTFRVTAWCGSCQNATSSIVSGPYTF